MVTKTIRPGFFALWGLALLLLTACGAIPPTQPMETPGPSETPVPTRTPQQALTLEESAQRVIQALADRDMTTLAQTVHPDQGVRFSPYTYVREEHLVFMPGELPGLFDSDEVYSWGDYDGTGEPIELTFSQYYDEFVYSADFANPEQIGYDREIGMSSMINNIHDFYPEAEFVEYHFSGFDPQYAGMDWESLRLVFLQEGETWYLVGIVHDEWTI